MHAQNTSQTVVQPASHGKRLWIVLILGILAGIGPIVTDLYLPALPQMSSMLQTSTSLIQLSLTACLLGLAIGQIILGPFSDVLGRRVPLIISLIIFVITSFLCAFSPSVWVLIGLRFVQGLAGAGGVVIARAIARDLYSGTELTKFFALLMLVNGVAPILSPVLGAQLLKITDWTGIFIVIGSFSVVMLLGSILGLKETLPVENRTKGGIKQSFMTFGKLFRNRSFMGYVLTQGLILAGMFAYISASPFVLQTIYGLTAQQFSFCFALNGLGMVIVTQISGRLVGRFTEDSLLKFGLILSITASSFLFLSILLKASIIFVLIPLFVSVSCVGFVTTTASSLAMNTQGRAAGSASALLGMSSFTLGAIMAPLVGIGGSHTAIPMVIMISICHISAILCYIFLAKKKAVSEK